MAPSHTRRSFLTGVGVASIAALAGCTSSAFPWTGETVDRTLYVGAYHWGFILLDEDGVERENIVLEQGSTVEIVGFGLESDAAVASLPAHIRETLPDHETLEERNVDQIPAPNEEFLHDALEEAEELYPDHSLVVVPGYRRRSGGMMDGGMMDGGMMGERGLSLLHDDSEARTMRLFADREGIYSMYCGIYCGYGHRYMVKSGVFSVT